jgi:sarcosine oxidase, subunit delta
MLWLTCPLCGYRPVDEFRFGGEVPDVPASLTDPDDRDVDRVWMFNNVDGISTERWFHEAGCRRWMTLRRNTSVDRAIED